MFSSLFGVGGGIVIVPLLIMVAAFGTREATATSLGAIVITALAGVALYALHGKVDVGYAALVGHPGDGWSDLRRRRATATLESGRDRCVRRAARCGWCLADRGMSTTTIVLAICPRRSPPE